jgi:formylglycine-generating enzyme required for sulfatase activity
MKFGWSSLLLLLLAQPAMAQRKYNKTISGPLEIATVKVKGGYFDMGSDDEALDRKPAHTVQLADYRMGAYEVKQQQWEAVMGENPSYYKCDECPVTNVSWDEVQEFIKKLNSTTGKNYRLPTEAEWEYAAREGNYERLTKYSRPRTAAGEVLAAENNKNLRTPEKSLKGEKYSGRSAGPQSIAWYVNNADSKVHPIGRKQPNKLGIYDMCGNAEEWTGDWYANGYGSKDTAQNPTGPIGGRAKVIRGGSFASSASEVIVTRRAAYLPNTKERYVGFRLVEEDK